MLFELGDGVYHVAEHFFQCHFDLLADWRLNENKGLVAVRGMSTLGIFVLVMRYAPVKSVPIT